jgi:hypothetical protein
MVTAVSWDHHQQNCQGLVNAVTGKWVTVLSDEKKVSRWRQGESCRHVARYVSARRKG